MAGGFCVSDRDPVVDVWGGGVDGAGDRTGDGELPGGAGGEGEPGGGIAERIGQLGAFGVEWRVTLRLGSVADPEPYKTTVYDKELFKDRVA